MGEGRVIPKVGLNLAVKMKKKNHATLKQFLEGVKLASKRRLCRNQSCTISSAVGQKIGSGVVISTRVVSSSGLFKHCTLCFVEDALIKNYKGNKQAVSHCQVAVFLLQCFCSISFITVVSA